MTTQEFIEKAIEGGWRIENKRAPKFQDCESIIDWFESSEEYAIKCLVLDPKAWEAVGKVEGWVHPWHIEEKGWDTWQHNMHLMIDALCSGRTIEEFLETL